MENVKHFIGVDISKRTIDLVIHSNAEHIRIENNGTGFKQMFKWFKIHKLSIGEIHLVMEHTGMYSFCLENFLSLKQIQYSKVNALEIKLSSGIIRGKSDKIDAARIARFGAQKATELKVYSRASNELERLKILNTSRENLVRTRTGLKNAVEELHNIGLHDKDLAVKAQLRVIKVMDTQIMALESEIKQIIQSEEKLAKNYALLTSIKGVGPVVATATLIKTQNFERFTKSRKFCCYSGVAPFEHSSGTSIKGKTRVNHLADKNMKTLLDLAAKSAINCDPELKAFFDRRIAMGKSGMSTINIIRNKIVGRMFAVIKRQTPFIADFRAVA